MVASVLYMLMLAKTMPGLDIILLSCVSKGTPVTDRPQISVTTFNPRVDFIRQVSWNTAKVARCSSTSVH